MKSAKTHVEPPMLGEVLKNEFMKPYAVTQIELGEALGFTRVHVQRILNGKQHPVSLDICVKLARLFETEPDFWIHVQAEHDAWLARQEYEKSDVKPIKTKNDVLNSHRITLNTTEFARHVGIDEGELIHALTHNEKINGVDVPRPLSSNHQAGRRFLFRDADAFKAALKKK
ncbi:TPA: HigA family addiction module antitoxin [Escherichia coli]|uniref:HigA family addiction module antitoxin n=1 Tax=Klebsiella pneumoniae TaxID=573 RepID=UPI001F5F2DDA|nr:HigA family addiction module antitoxin [Klebsiella pneumoniae]